MKGRYEFEGFDNQPTFEEFEDELFTLAHPGDHAHIVGRFSGSTTALLATWDKHFAL